MNRRIARWNTEKPPADWRSTLYRWELSHALRASLMLFTATMLAAAISVGL